MTELRADLDERLRLSWQAEAGSASAAQHGAEVWSRCEALTQGLASELTEQLRLILEPTLASKLAGDYRTGGARGPLGEGPGKGPSGQMGPGGVPEGHGLGEGA